MSNIVFIDSRVADIERLIAGLAADAQVVMLDPTRDGLAQIAQALIGVTELDSIHIVSHGSCGALYLGATVAAVQDLDDHASDLAQIGASLSEEGDILLYGCDVGAGAEGLSFIEKFALHTGADVAASTDATGNAALGGDWQLEAATGVIESNVVITTTAQDAYGALLPATPPPTQLSALNGTNGFRLDGVAASDFSGCAVSDAGDVNGDGYGDVIVGASRANVAGADAGASYVVFGKASGFGAGINLSTLDGTTGFRLRGGAASDYSGSTVSAAGDVNGDGFADIIVGALGADPNGSKSGASYVVFGKASGFASSINLSTLNGTTGFRIAGEATYDRVGNSVSGAGDINGDGFDDLIVGAYGYGPIGSYYGVPYGQRGASYVVFGQASGFGSNLAVSALNGSNGFRIIGENFYDLSGRSVSAAGDVNGDGFDDLMIGAWWAAPYGTKSGASYVVFGKASGFTGSVSLNTLTLPGAGGFQLNGGAAYDHSGNSVSGAGDVNGDGFDDVIVGAFGADVGLQGDAGASYVVFGQAGEFPSDTNLATQLNGSNGFKISGVAASDTSGAAVSAAGDVNGDGYDDLLVGATGAGASGATYVVFGKPGAFAANINLSSLNGTNGFKLTGGTAGDSSGYSVSAAGDVNGDGFDDLIVGASNADPNGADSGSSYVVFGGNFTGAVTFLGTSAANTLSGTSAAETFVSAQGSDTLNGGGGADVFHAGEGNDRIRVAGTSFEEVDGGSGIDTLALAGGGHTLDLTAPGSGRISGIEVIDLTGSGDNSLKLSVRDVLDLSGTSNTLRVAGDAGDVVQGGNWNFTQNVVIGAQTYAVYTKGAATLQVDVDVARDVMPLNGANGFRLDGVAGVDNSGQSVSGAGDINGDGYDDVIVGAGSADPNGISNSGSSYVVFGSASEFASSINLSSLNGTTGFRLDGVTIYDKSGSSVSSAGDVNGDGLADLIIGAPNAATLGSTPGASYVVFGQSSGFASSLNLSALNGTTGFKLTGELYHLAGFSVSGAGDINGDGFDDLIVGAPNYFTGAYGPNGATYVVFGRASGFASNLAVSALDGSNGFRITGENYYDSAGRSVSAAGDVNGDGFDDLIIGGWHASVYGTYGGASYVVFGKASGFGASVSLATLTATGVDGFQLNGGASYDLSGVSVSDAGDVNGDGFDDVIVGAHRANPNGNDTGASYIVFGKAGGFSTDTNLATLNLNGTAGFTLSGVATYDYAGFSVSAAGDVNGDGFDDLLVGADLADPRGASSGATYVVFGAGAFATKVDLAGLNGTNGFKLSGVAGGDISGFSVSAAGDVNGDGFDDFIVGAPGAAPNGSSSGSSYVVFGGNFTGAVTFLGTSGADALGGTSAAESFVSAEGNDTLTGGGGADVFHAGAGNDRIRVSSNTFEVVDGGSGTDVLALIGSGLALDLTTPGNNRIGGIEVVDVTGSGNNTLTVSALSLLDLSGTDNTLKVNGDAGDVVTLTGAGSGVMGLSGSYDRIALGSAILLVDTDITLKLVGSENLNDTLTGTTSADALTGLGGNDTLTGGGGNDTLTGGTGTDTANYAAAASGVTVDLAITAAQATGGAGVDTVTEVERLIGSAFNDRLAGNEKTNYLWGANGNDTLVASVGADTLHGGSGTDVANFSALGAAVTVNLATGVAGSTTLVEIENLTGSPFADTLTGDTLVNLIAGGSGNDTIAGGSGTANDTLGGGAGDDTFVIAVGRGADLVTDFSGEDGIRITNAPINTFVFDDVNDSGVSLTTGQVHVASNGATTTLYIGLDGTPGADLEVDLTGIFTANQFRKGLGSDTIFLNHAPTVANAIPNRNATEDSAFSYQVSANTFTDLDGDTFTYTATKADGNPLPGWLDFDANTRTFSGTPGNGLVGFVDIKVGVTDNWGAAASDVFRITVANTNDAPVVSNPISEKTAPVNDLFSFTFAGNTFTDPDVGDSLSYTASRANGSALPAWLTFNANTRTFSGTPGAALLGTSYSIEVTATDESNATVSTVFTLAVTAAGSGGDPIVGDAGDNNLSGTTGDDTINGAAGADTMTGFQGDDTYIVENAGDVVVEQFSQGTDLVRSAVTHTLAHDVENLLLTGGANINGTGNNLFNQITGNGGQNSLDGGSGIDILEGGAGNDTYIVDNVNDQIVEGSGAGAGNDLVKSSVSYSLAANVERLTLTGSADINGTGNVLDNTLTGNTGNNELQGSAGADTMVGGVGDDTYIVDNVLDVVTENPDAGTDLVQSSVTWTLGDDVENLILTGGANRNGVGNTLANQLTGNDGDNVLTGGGANDTLNGGVGDDTLRGGAGNDRLDGGSGTDSMEGGTGNDVFFVDTGTDVVVELAGEGTADQVVIGIDFTAEPQVFQLYDNIERVSVVDINAGIAVTGNDLDNLFQGSNAEDSLDGAAGNDTIEGLGGNDTLEGGADADSLEGGDGSDLYYVDDVGDVVVETSNGPGPLADGPAGLDNFTDTVIALIDYSLSGVDYVENLTLGSGATTGTGNELNNVVTGNNLANTLSGLGGADTINGGAGKDTLTGGTGGDVLKGGTGADRLTGSGGADTFDFSTTLNAVSNVDRIMDFTGGVDEIQLDHTIFTAIATGNLAAGAFYAHAGATAGHDLNDRIIYNSTNGNLYYDADGNGAAAATLFAILSGTPAPTAGDFLIIS